MVVERRRRQQRHRRRRRHVGDKRQVHVHRAALRARFRDDRVEQRRQLGDALGAITEVLRRPRHHVLPRFRRHRDLARGIGGQRDFAERPRDGLVQQRELFRPSRGGVTRGAHRFSVGVGLLPVDGLGWNAEQMQRRRGHQRRGIRRGRRRRERQRHDDAVGDARELAVAQKRGSVVQKNPVQRSLGGRRLRPRRRGAAQQRDDGEGAAKPPCGKHVDERWKACGHSDTAGKFFRARADIHRVCCMWMRLRYFFRLRTLDAALE
jgi:hypothetical protein